MRWICFGLAALVFGSSGSAQQTFDNALVTLIDDVHLASREAGHIQSVLVQPGAQVRKGDLLVQLVSRLYEIDVTAAAVQSEIAATKAENDIDLQYAIKSSEVADKQKEMLEIANAKIGGSFSQIELDEARLQAERAKLAIEQAKRDLEVARLEAQLESTRHQAAQTRLELRSLRAPFDGTIVRVTHQAGEWVDVGQPMVHVINLEKLRVKLFVDSARYDHRLLDRKVKLTVSLPPDSQIADFFGHVTFVSPQVDATSGLIEVWAEVENDPQRSLRSGIRGSLTLLDDNNQ